jgi:hypothetical protein
VGPWVDGGGWIDIEGTAVDWIYRNVDSIMVKIDSATLIALRRDGRQYVWSPIASARLGHG